jgi:hypothetical protein
MNYINEYLKVTVIQYDFVLIIEETSSLNQGHTKDMKDKFIPLLGIQLRTHQRTHQGPQIWGHSPKVCMKRSPRIQRINIKTSAYIYFYLIHF